MQSAQDHRLYSIFAIISAVFAGSFLIMAFSSFAAVLFMRTLQLGSRGDEVILLQQTLAKDSAIYPHGLVTGYFGVLTKAAVQRFQIRYNIVSSGTPETTGFGVVGPRTRAVLNTLLSSSAATTNRGPFSTLSPPLPSASPLSPPLASASGTPLPPGQLFSTDCNQAPKGVGSGYCWQTQAIVQRDASLCDNIKAFTMDLSPGFCKNIVSAPPPRLDLTLFLNNTYKIGEDIAGVLQVYNHDTTNVYAFSSLSVKLFRGNTIIREHSFPLFPPAATSSVFLPSFMGSELLNIPAEQNSIGEWTLTVTQMGTSPPATASKTFNAIY